VRSRALERAWYDRSPRESPYRVVLLALVGTLVHLFSLGACAASDVTAGRRLAERWCSNCHVVGPTEQQGTSTGAPPFSAIAQMSSTTPMSLRAFLMTSHPPMPDLHLTRDEIDDVSTYIISLKRR
jgi:mono/diheme cytochrome c family protein